MRRCLVPILRLGLTGDLSRRLGERDRERVLLLITGGGLTSFRTLVGLASFSGRISRTTILLPPETKKLK